MPVKIGASAAGGERDRADAAGGLERLELGRLALDAHELAVDDEDPSQEVDLVQGQTEDLPLPEPGAGGQDAHDYDVVEFDTASWASSLDMVDDLARRLGFPSSFGRNLDALNDGMRDVAAGDHGWRPEAAGLVIVLRAFDRLTAIERTTAQHLLDILANQARSAILIGNRILCLVQWDDPTLEFEPVGAMPVVWNDAEWLKSQRGS